LVNILSVIELFSSFLPFLSNINSPVKEIVKQEWPLIIAGPNWELKLPEFDTIQISNGAQVYSLKSNKEGLCYLEFVFEIGRFTELK